MNYEKDLYIDHLALDVEWLEQGNLARKYGQHFTECQDELTRAEENVKIIRSELKMNAYENPEKVLGKGIKPTGDIVESYYRKHPDHIEAKERWMDAKKAAEDAEIAYNQINVKRVNALNKLVELLQQGYFMGPEEPHDLDEIRKQKSERANKKAMNRIKRRK